MIYYERLFSDPKSELRRLFITWGTEVSEERLSNAIQNNEIKKLKQEGKSTWREIPVTHFRRGGSGHYLEELPSPVLKDIEERFGSYLKRWGYLTSANVQTQLKDSTE